MTLSLFSNGKDGIKSGSSNIEVKHVEKIEFRNVKFSLLQLRIEKYENKAIKYRNSENFVNASFFSLSFRILFGVLLFM